MLHNDKTTFQQLILRIFDDTGIAPGIIEKDYYVTLFLQRIAERVPNIIFKGGTSLSKCYRIIDRFSEDIDLNIDTETKPTEGQRKKLKETIVSVVDEYGFILSNSDDVRSRRDYNRYIIDYPTVFPANYLKEYLIVETAVYIKAYPCKRMTATSMIYDYLLKHGYNGLIEQYGLHPFELNVQTAERTLVDKLFALCDYYLADAVHEHSRHIYDIYKLLGIVELNESIKQLVQEVCQERKPHKNCRSAQDDMNRSCLLREIIDRNIYREDYHNVTEKLLFEPVSYDVAISALQKILDSDIFQ